MLYLPRGEFLLQIRRLHHLSRSLKDALQFFFFSEPDVEALEVFKRFWMQHKRTTTKRSSWKPFFILKTRCSSIFLIRLCLDQMKAKSSEGWDFLSK